MNDENLFGKKIEDLYRNDVIKMVINSLKTDTEIESERRGFDIAVKVIKNNFPNVDFYGGTLKKGPAIIIGTQRTDGHSARPFLAIYTERKVNGKHADAYVGFRMDHKIDREEIKREIDKDEKWIRSIFLLSNIEKDKSSLESYLNELKRSAVIQDRARGSSKE